MRNFPLTVRAFLGAAALSTLVAACEDAEPPKKIAVVSTPAPAAPKPEARVEPPTPPPAVEVATKAATPTRDAGNSDTAKSDGSVDQLLADARAAIDKGELDRALGLARRATKKAPTRSAAFNTLGRVQLKRGERKRRDRQLRKGGRAQPVVELRREQPRADPPVRRQVRGGRRRARGGDAAEPVAPYMWNNLGMAYEHLDRLDEARDAYKQAVAAAADDAGGAVAKGNLTRLAGVQSVKPMRTARIDSVGSDVAPVSSPPSSSPSPSRRRRRRRRSPPTRSRTTAASSSHCCVWIGTAFSVPDIWHPSPVPL